MRKSFDTLAVITREQMRHDVLRGDVFVFVGRDRRRAKLLWWDGTGLCVLAKYSVPVSEVDSVDLGDGDRVRLRCAARPVPCARGASRHGPRCRRARCRSRERQRA